MIIDVVGFNQKLPEPYRTKFQHVLSQHYNYAPKHFREISEKEFVQNTLFNTYTPIATVYQQLHSNYNGTPLTIRKDGVLTVRLFLYHDGTGVGISCDYWEGKLRFFRFGCTHKYIDYDKEYAERHNLPYISGRCMHNTVCTECGNVWQYDSSD